MTTNDYWRRDVFWLGEIIAFIISLFLTFIPIVGGALGTYGAIEYWSWDWWWAALLFYWYIPWILSGFIISILIGVLAKLKGERY